MDHPKDTEPLRTLYTLRPTNKAALDHFAGRRYSSTRTTVERLQALLRQEGHDVPRGDIIDLFKGLEAAKCGKFVVGRKGHPSRFEWSVSLISVGRAAAGEVTEVQALSESEQNAVIEEEEAGGGWIAHCFVLRPGVEVRLDLPSDLTNAEADRLAEFVRALPFSR
jgi:hypothetical protein